MCQPKKWWWGLLPLAVLFGLLSAMTTGPIEGDLVQRSAEVFKTSGIPWAKLSLSGRDAVISGEAPNPESQKLATSTAERTWGVRQVADATTVAPEIRPYAATATREGNRITLTGTVPTDAVRKVLVDRAKAAFPGAEVVDQLKDGRGFGAAYMPGMAFGLDHLGKLATGTVGMSDSTFSIAGAASDFVSFDAAQAAIKQLPQGITLGRAEISPPKLSPFPFSAVKEGDTLNLSGVIPSEAARKPLIAAAAAAGASKIAESLRVADGLPASVDFAKASEFVFGQLGKLKSGAASLKGDALTISGAAEDEDGFNAVKSALSAALPGGLKLAAQDIKGPAAVVPYLWSATRAAGAITLEGLVPSEKIRSGVLDVVKSVFPSDRVVDQMKLGAGAPAGFLDAITAGLKQLARLPSGAVSLTNTAMKIVGETMDGALPDQVKSGLSGAGLPAGFAANTQIAVKAPPPPPPPPAPPAISPYTWGAARAADTVTLSGYVPSDDLRGTLVAAAKKAFPTDRIVDLMRLGSGAPEGFAAAVSSALSQLAKLPTGGLTLTDKVLKMTGETGDKSLLDAIRAALSGTGLPAGFSTDLQIRLKELAPAPAPAPAAPQVIAPPPAIQVSPDVGSAPPASVPSNLAPPAAIATSPALPTAAQICQQKFVEILKNDTILFATGSARISASSQAVLKLLASAAQACPSMQIEIQGHTDKDGNPEANLELSERRAEAVVQALKGLGVTDAHMSHKGYGETQPVAPNDTPENKAKNRRIEFVVTK